MPPKKGVRSDDTPGRPVMSPFNRMMQADLPETAAQMEVWMEETRAHLLEYLTWWHHKSHLRNKRTAIEQATKSEEDEWDKWKDQADVQTGEIYWSAQRTRMINAMSRHHDILQKQYEDESYGFAQEFWEDFLYYQNPWNRRGKGPDDVEYQGLKPPQLIQRMKKAADKPSHLWRICLISLYDIHRIGFREDVRDTVDVDHVHRYPETVVRAQESSERRKQHLEKMFPSNPVALEFDKKAITARCQQVQLDKETKKKALDPDAMEIDFDGRREEMGYYSAATASSWRDGKGNPVPVSWESSLECGPVIGPVRRRCTTAIPHGKLRYKVKENATHVRTFNWSHMNAAGSRNEGRLAQKSKIDSGFRGRYLSQIRFEKMWVLDEKDQRIPETDAPINLTHDFSTPSAKHSIVYELSAEHSIIQGEGRKEKERRRKDNGLEDEDHYSNQPSDDGGDRSIGSDDDSDSDDGDLFALSYRTCVCACHHDEGCSRKECRGSKEHKHNSAENGGVNGRADNKTYRGDGDEDSENSDGDDGNSNKDKNKKDSSDDGSDGEYSGNSSSSGDSSDGDGEISRNTIIKGKKIQDKAVDQRGSVKTLTNKNTASPDKDATPSVGSIYLPIIGGGNRKVNEKNPQPASSNSTPKDNKTTRAGRAIPSRCKTSSDAQAKSTSGFSRDDKLTNEGTLVHKSYKNLADETFTPHPTDSSLNICEYNPGWKKFPNFIQRNEVPAPRMNAKKDPTVTYTIVPKEVNIPTSTAEGTRILDSVWTRDQSADPTAYPSGRYTCVIEVKIKGKTTSRKLEWIPQPILRLFRRDTGEYMTRYESWSGLEEMIGKNVLDKDDVMKFNKSVNQHYGRRDAEAAALTKPSGPWTNADNDILQKVTDQAIQKYGLRNMNKDQAKRLSEIVSDFNGERKPTDTGYRSSESIRAKLNRDKFWLNIKNRIEDLEKEYGEKEIKDVDLRPKDRSFFVFKRKKENLKKKRGLISRPRAASRRKRKRGENDDGDSEAKNGDEYEGEHSSENDSGGDGSGDDRGPYDYEDAPKKRARR